MSSFSGRTAGIKEKALFGATWAAFAVVAIAVLSWERPVPEMPTEPQLPPPKPVGAIMGADELYSTGRLDDYWVEGARNIFVQPTTKVDFKPVALEVPTVAPPRPPMPLPDPGPFLQNSGPLPRLGDSAALSAPAPSPAPAPAPAPAPGPAPGPKPPAGGGK